jgi:molybdopterin synthase sulfur carrier subunit
VAVVFIPAALRRLTGGHERLEIRAGSVGALIDAIDATYPGFRARVADGDDLLPSVAVAVDGDVVAGGLAEALAPDSEVHFVPALGGGR